MTQLSSGESHGGDSGKPNPDLLGLGFLSGGGIVVPDLLGLGSPVVGVGEDGVVGVRTNESRSMALWCALGCSEANTWRVPESKSVGPATVRGLTSSSGPVNPPRSTDHKICL
jgi:hypothetical protein